MYNLVLIIFNELLASLLKTVKKYCKMVNFKNERPWDYGTIILLELQGVRPWRAFGNCKTAVLWKYKLWKPFTLTERVWNLQLNKSNQNFSLNTLKSNGPKYFKNIKINTRRMIWRDRECFCTWRQAGGKRLGKEANLLQDSLVDEGKSAKLLINLPSGMPEFILEEPPKQR